MRDQPHLGFDAGGSETADARARRLAVDPSHNVALEASAGTGKTRVLVDRYVRLLEAGVPPRHILAITFTRKAAAEMRERVMAALRERHQLGALTDQRWREIKDAIGDISISTIDAFCLALLHEFPLEAGVDPGFTLADETETPRLVEGSLDRALRVGRHLALADADVALVFAELGEAPLRQGLAALLERRLVASVAINRFLRGREMHVDTACARLVQALTDGLTAVPGVPPGGSARAGVAILGNSGPDDPAFAVLVRDLTLITTDPGPSPAQLRGALDRLAALVLTQSGEPRKRLVHKRSQYRSAADYERHKAAVTTLGPRVAAAIEGFRRDINLVLARGVRRLFAVAQDEYRRALDELGALDFPDLLERSLRLLGQMEEFSRSRYRLESRYEHLLVDEFQDTSRAQWQLVRELVRAWAAGEGSAHGPIPPSIFIVGDRKQSIYGFRDAEVTVLDAAAKFIQALRPDRPTRAAITRSFRSVPRILSFVNDVCAAIDKLPERPDAFRYGDDDRFPETPPGADDAEALGVVAAGSDEAQAEMVAEEITRLLLDGVVVRDRKTGVRRPVTPGDVAVLFRTRESHVLFEVALGRRGVPFYVYKGLGFFDASEVKDVLALIAYLADPASDLRAAAMLRSRFVRLSDEALKVLAPSLAGALTAEQAPTGAGELSPDDRARLDLARGSLREWVRLADQLPPAELVDRALAESAYHVELAGPGFAQARENLKKVRGLVRRIQNRGYATLGRLAAYFAELVAGGDESNAIIDAANAVNLMTVHAAKGLEFPVVFLVNLGKGSGGGRAAIRVVAPAFVEDDESADAPAGSVAVGTQLSDADHDADAREHEETKRLLYVALTRARDRLYLGVTVTGGKVSMGKGSLGRILPASLLASMASAPDATNVCWPGDAGPHVLRRCGPPRGGALQRSWRPNVIVDARTDDFEAMPPTGIDRIVSARRAQRETRPGQLMAGGAVVFDAPYSMLDTGGRMVRGRIDCLVASTEGVTVVEFRTGLPSSEHQAQLETSLGAARAMFPGRTVDGRLVYGND